MLGVVLGMMRSDTNRRIDHLEVSLRSEMRAMRDEFKSELAALRDEFHREVGAVRADTSASIERLSDRQHADSNAINARLDVLLLARGSLAGMPDAAQVSGGQQPATAAESDPEYRVSPPDADDSDRA